MDDSRRPGSLYLVLQRDDLRPPYFCSILQLDSKPKPKSPKGSIKWLINGFIKGIKRMSHSSFLGRQRQLDLDKLDQKEYAAHFRRHLDHQKEYVAHFNLLNPPATQVPPSITWVFTPLSNQELCLVPYLSAGAYRSDVPPLHGFTFNFRTNTYRRISPSNSSSKSGGCVVSLGGHIYYMPQPAAFYNTPNLIFERYDPVGDSWETLKPFPLPPDVHKFRHILATAVWDVTILFNMGGREIWAYNVRTDTWYLVTVEVEDKLCYRIVGEAVVKGNTIYALKDESYNSILALSIQSVENNMGDLVYTCSLLSEILVPDIQRILPTEGNPRWETRYLVHLGQDDFCIVQSCMLDCYPAEYQPIQVTCMKLEGKDKMIVMNNRVHKLPIVDDQQFNVNFCFSLPECKFPPGPAAVKQTDRFFDIDPFPMGFDISQIYRTPYKLETGAIVNPSLKVAAKSNVDASKGSETVKGGGLTFEGRPLDSYSLPERSKIINRWRQEHMSEMKNSFSSRKKNSSDGEGSGTTAPKTGVAISHK